MFVAWRDLRFAHGRFVLIGSVVLLITLLVGFLGGLTQGLANANISGITSLGADKIAFAQPAAGQSVSFTDSAITRDQVDTWRHSHGVATAEPLGILTTKVEAQDDLTSAATLFGVTSGFSSFDGDQRVPVKQGTVVLSEPAATALSAEVGDTVTIAGAKLDVAAIDGNAEYGHTPVIWAALADWNSVAAVQSGGEAPFASVIAVKTDSGADTSAIDTKAGTAAESILPALLGISSFKSEIGSLLMMMVLLFGISALVIGAFFTVWTIQRLGDIAVLKALGASTASLVRDALGQASVVLVIGVGAGIGITTLLGILVSGSIPFVVSALTTIVPGVAMILLGLLGAAFALRSVTKADPLTALNGQNA